VTKPIPSRRRQVLATRVLSKGLLAKILYSSYTISRLLYLFSPYSNTRIHGSTQQNPHKAAVLAPPSRKSRSRTPAAEPTQIFTIRVAHAFLQSCFKHDPDSRGLIAVTVSLVSICCIISSPYDGVVVTISLAAISLAAYHFPCAPRVLSPALH
jgi:hypothetical protein